MLPIFLVTKFNIDHIALGLIYSYIGVWMMINQSLVTTKLFKKFAVDPVTLWCLAGVILIFSLTILLENSMMVLLLFFLPFVAVLQSTMQTGISTSVSKAGSASSQGSLQGISSSVRTLPSFIGPILGGLLISTHITIPFILSVFFAITAWLVCQKYSKKQ